MEQPRTRCTTQGGNQIIVHSIQASTRGDEKARCGRSQRFRSLSGRDAGRIPGVRRTSWLVSSPAVNSISQSPPFLAGDICQWPRNRAGNCIVGKSDPIADVAARPSRCFVLSLCVLSVPAARSAGSTMLLVQPGARREVYKYKSTLL